MRPFFCVVNAFYDVLEFNRFLKFLHAKKAKVFLAIMSVFVMQCRQSHNNENFFLGVENDGNSLAGKWSGRSKTAENFGQKVKDDEVKLLDSSPHMNVTSKWRQLFTQWHSNLFVHV